MPFRVLIVWRMVISQVPVRRRLAMTHDWMVSSPRRYQALGQAMFLWLIGNGYVSLILHTYTAAFMELRVLQRIQYYKE